MVRTEHTVRAAYDRLDAVRVHTPGPELLSGSLDPEPNLFDGYVPPDQARREHERIVAAIEDAGVDVHQLADDLAAGDALTELARRHVTVPDDFDLDGVLSAFDARETLGLVLARAHVEPEPDGATSVRFERPLSNTLFQADSSLIGDRGPVLCEMYEPVRRPEVPLARRAWEGVGAEVVHDLTDEPVEGGEFLPAGEFALLGVSAEIEGKEEVIRTTYAGGRNLLDSGAVGYDEVGLVRAPLAADRRLRAEHGTGTRVLHLLGWCNLAAEDVAVVDTTLAEAAAVDVYVRKGDDYALDRSTSTLAYLREKGFEIVDTSPAERWAANFLPIDDGRILTLYEPGPDGEYDPDRNPTIERLRERGVEVLPDDTGLPVGTLTNGAGGINCMTIPLGRR